MADIDVVPKSGRSVWLWIVLAIVIALILWAVIAGMSGGNANRVGELLERMPAVPTYSIVAATA
jgi:hypothetical protein